MSLYALLLLFCSRLFSFSVFLGFSFDFFFPSNLVCLFFSPATVLRCRSVRCPCALHASPPPHFSLTSSSVFPGVPTLKISVLRNMWQEGSHYRVPHQELQFFMPLSVRDEGKRCSSHSPTPGIVSRRSLFLDSTRLCCRVAIPFVLLNDGVMYDSVGFDCRDRCVLTGGYCRCDLTAQPSRCSQAQPRIDDT